MLQGSSLTRLAHVALTCAAAFIGWTSLPAQADNYPSRAIRLIVPSPPGGGTDTQAHPGAEAERTARPDRGDRQPAGRQRQYRRPGRLQGLARRLHALGDDLLPRDQ